MSGNSDFVFFTMDEHLPFFSWVKPGAASAACPSQPGNLEMISMILAAVIWDAGDPSSVNMSPRSTTRPLFLVLCLQFSIFQMTYVHQWCKMNCSALHPCFIDHLFFYFWLLSGSTPKFSPIFPIPCPRCFRCRNFHSLRHRNKLVNQIVVLWWILTFSCNMVFMMIRYRISHTHSCGFISFQNTRKFCFNFVGSTTPTILLHNFTRHGRSDWCFQLLTRVLDGFFEFRILRVDEIDPSQFSSVFKMELFIRPLLLFLQLGVLSHWLQRIIEGLSWMQAVFSSISSGPHMSVRSFLLSNRVNCVKPVQGSDKSLDPWIFQLSSMRFSCLTSKFVWVVLETWMHCSGIGNDSSLGE